MSTTLCSVFNGARLISDAVNSSVGTRWAGTGDLLPAPAIRPVTCSLTRKNQAYLTLLPVFFTIVSYKGRFASLKRRKIFRDAVIL